MDGDFATTLVQCNGDAVLMVAGEIDASTSPRLFDACAEMTWITSGLVLDLARVPFMDSSGLHVLVQMNQCPHTTRVVVRNAPDQVRRLLEITELATEFLEVTTEVAAEPGSPASELRHCVRTSTPERQR